MSPKCSGFTLLEVLMVLSITTVLMGIAVFNFRALENPADNGAALVAGYLRKARAKAMASTSAYTISPSTSTILVATSGTTCNATTQTSDPEMNLELPSGATFAAVGWSLCYGSRGIANNSVDIQVSDASTSRVVQAVLGGGVKIQ
jgi:type IV fimbrial biogenesis protein FimT